MVTSPGTLDALASPQQVMPEPLAPRQDSVQISEHSRAGIDTLFPEAPLTPLVPLFWCLGSSVR